jgi:hypothetical protein
MVLPFTVATSLIFLHSRPSFLVLLACALVTLGFFVGVFLDGTSVSMIGIFFGVASSVITAVHSVVIKKSLEVVKGSALHLSWYTNLYSTILLFPIVILAGEGPDVSNLLFGNISKDAFSAFLWGSMITVSVTSPLSEQLSTKYHIGYSRVFDEHRQSALHQGHLSHHTHGLIRRSRSRRVPAWGTVLPRCHHQVRVHTFDIMPRTDLLYQRPCFLHRDHLGWLCVLYLGQTQRIRGHEAICPSSLGRR